MKWLQENKNQIIIGLIIIALASMAGKFWEIGLAYKSKKSNLKSIDFPETFIEVEVDHIPFKGILEMRLKRSKDSNILHWEPVANLGCDDSEKCTIVMQLQFKTPISQKHSIPRFESYGNKTLNVVTGSVHVVNENIISAIFNISFGLNEKPTHFKIWIEKI